MWSIRANFLLPWSEWLKQFQSSLHNTIQRETMYPSKSTEATTLNRAVTYFITKDMQPVYTVERSSFKFLVSKLNPRYNIPSRKHFTEVEIPRLTLRLYTEVRETVVKQKSSLQSQKTCGLVELIILTLVSQSTSLIIHGHSRPSLLKQFHSSRTTVVKTFQRRFWTCWQLESWCHRTCSHHNR